MCALDNSNKKDYTDYGKYFTDFFENYSYRKFKVEFTDGSIMHYMTGPKDKENNRVISYSLYESQDGDSYKEIKEAPTREGLIEYLKNR